MSRPDHTDPVFRATVAERRRIAGLLRDLTPKDWAAPSLCDGWRIREVVAHITLAYRYSTPRVLWKLVRARGDWNKLSDRTARQDAARLSDQTLLACLEANVEHPWRPPGGGQAGALSHDVIHSFDITEPLGLPRSPVDHVELVLRSSGPKNIAFFGVDLTGRRLEATDAHWKYGDGARVIGAPAADLLLMITGRAPVPAPD